MRNTRSRRTLLPSAETTVVSPGTSYRSVLPGDCAMLRPVFTNAVVVSKFAEPGATPLRLRPFTVNVSFTQSQMLTDIAGTAPSTKANEMLSQYAPSVGEQPDVTPNRKHSCRFWSRMRIESGYTAP